MNAVGLSEALAAAGLQPPPRVVGHIPWSVDDDDDDDRSTLYILFGAAYINRLPPW